MTRPFASRFVTNGDAGSTSPGSAPAAMTAGAFGMAAPGDRVTAYSSRGSKVFLRYMAIALKDGEKKTYDVLGIATLNTAGAVRVARQVDFIVADKKIVSSRLAPRRVQRGACRTIIAGRPNSCSQHIIWGDTVVLGDSVYYNVPASSPEIVWVESASMVWGQALNAGDNTVWTTQATTPSGKTPTVSRGAMARTSSGVNVIAVGNRTGGGQQ